MLEADKIFRVDGIVAVVTGGGSGIGLMMAKALATNGAKKVHILGRRQDVLQKAANEHESIVPLQCDITSKESLQNAVDRITTDVGYVNVVIANSGTLGPLNGYAPHLSISELRSSMFTATSMEEFTDAFHVNVTATFFTMAAFLELLDAGNKNAMAGGYGAPINGSKVPSIQSQVIFTSSVGALMRSYFTPPAYGGSKAAILHLAKQAATQLAPYGIRANALAPGLFPSDMAVGLIQDRIIDEETPEDPNFIPARKLGGEEEMGGAILYLCSRAGSFTDGMVLLNDGGRIAVIPATY